MSKPGRKPIYSGTTQERNRQAARVYKLRHPEKQMAFDFKNKGWTVEAYWLVNSAQEGRCAICREFCKVHSRLSADHNHVTRKPRGLLCNACNTALGKFKDNVLLLERAIAYLRKYEENHND